MRQILLAIAMGTLSACHWLTPPPTASGANEPAERQILPAKTETEAVASIEPGETGGICGGIAGFKCKNENDFCQLSPGDCRNIADAAGICVIKSAMCTMQYEPVCGCNGRTYGNACTAAASGISVAESGQCP